MTVNAGREMVLPSPACRQEPSRPQAACAGLQPGASLGKGNWERLGPDQCSQQSRSCPSGSVPGSVPGSSPGRRSGRSLPKPLPRRSCRSRPPCARRRRRPRCCCVYALVYGRDVFSATRGQHPCSQACQEEIHSQMLMGRWEEEGGCSPALTARASSPGVPATGSAWARHGQRVGAVPGLLPPDPPGMPPGVTPARADPSGVRPPVNACWGVPRAGRGCRCSRGCAVGHGVPAGRKVPSAAVAVGRVGFSRSGDAGRGVCGLGCGQQPELKPEQALGSHAREGWALPRALAQSWVSGGRGVAVSAALQGPLRGVSVPRLGLGSPGSAACLLLPLVLPRDGGGPLAASALGAAGGRELVWERCSPGVGGGGGSTHLPVPLAVWVLVGTSWQDGAWGC